MSNKSFVLDEIVEHAFDHGIALAKFARLRDPEATPIRLAARWKVRIETARAAGLLGDREQSGHEERLFVWPRLDRDDVAFVWMDLKEPGDNDGDWLAVHILDDWDPASIRLPGAIESA